MYVSITKQPNDRHYTKHSVSRRSRDPYGGKIWRTGIPAAGNKIVFFHTNPWLREEKVFHEPIPPMILVNSPQKYLMLIK